MNEHAFDDVEKLLKGYSVSSSEAFSSRALREAISRWLSRVSSLTVRIPGIHSGGISNERLLRVRRREGRDFAQWTVQLKQGLAQSLYRRFHALQKVPTIAELETFGAPLALDWIVSRVERGGRDLLLEKLTKEYRAAKRAAGFGARPVGVRTGEWLASLKNGSVRFKYA